MRVKHIVAVHIAEDADMKLGRFDTDKCISEVVIDTLSLQASGDFIVPAEERQELTTGAVGIVFGFYIRVNADCELYLNDNPAGARAVAIQLKKASTTQPYAKLFMEAAATKIEIKAPVGVDISGVFCVWGDPASS